MNNFPFVRRKNESTQCNIVISIFLSSMCRWIDCVCNLFRYIHIHRIMEMCRQNTKSWWYNAILSHTEKNRLIRLQIRLLITIVKRKQSVEGRKKHVDVKRKSSLFTAVVTKGLFVWTFSTVESLLYLLESAQKNRKKRSWTTKGKKISLDMWSMHAAIVMIPSLILLRNVHWVAPFRWLFSFSHTPSLSFFLFCSQSLCAYHRSRWEEKKKCDSIH